MSVQQEYFKAIADKIREKINSSELIKPVDFALKLDEVYEAGKKSEYDTFWDAFQDNGKRTNYEYGFSGSGWNDTTLKPKYPLILTTGRYMFRYADVTHLPTIDLRNLDDAEYVFAYADALHTIEKIILKSDGSTAFSNTFHYANSLENVTFEGVIGTSVSFVRSSKLSTASIDNIIEHLKDLSGELSQTITFHSGTGDKLTDARKRAIQDKNWDLVY